MKQSKISQIYSKYFKDESEKIQFLEELEHNLYKKELNHEFSNEEINIIRKFNIKRKIDETYGLDYNLDLINVEPIICDQNFPILFSFICLPKEKNKGLIVENHGSTMGYHMHYVVVLKKKLKRTNVLFTFNSKGGNPTNYLYWENHSGDIEKRPERFKSRRKLSIYDTSCSFLKKIDIKEFKSPKKNAQIFWPES